MKQVLNANQDTGDPFPVRKRSIVTLDVYTDGWFVEYAVKKSDEAQMVWKRWHNQPLRQHGNGSWVSISGTEMFRWRLNSGTQGATAYVDTDKVEFFN